MKIFKFVILFILFVALSLFAYTNTQFVNFNIPFGNNYQISLIIILLVTFVIGAFFGILSMLFRVLSLRGQVTYLNKELKKSQETIYKLSDLVPENTVVITDHQPKPTKHK